MIKYFIVLILSTSIFGQSTNFRFEKITTKEGLSQNSITAIIQNQTGYLWFGTPNGLNRYDGYTFKVIRDKDNNTTHNITALAEDGAGNIWIGTSLRAEKDIRGVGNT